MPKVKLGQSIRPEARRETFNKIIGIAMIRNGIKTQDRLAALLHMDHSAVGKRIRGDSAWKYNELCNLFRELHLSTEEAAVAMGVQSAQSSGQQTVGEKGGT